MNNSGYLFRSVIVGPSNAGKTSICKQIGTGSFPTVHDCTIGVDLQVFTVSLPAAETVAPKQLYKYHLWDTAGQERFDSITSNYYRNAAVILVVVSPDTSLATFKKKVLKSLDTGSLVVTILNKVDIDPKYWLFQIEDYRNLAKQLKVELSFEISAKNHQQVVDMFNKITEALGKRFQQGYKNGIQQRSSLSIDQPNKSMMSSCC